MFSINKTSFFSAVFLSLALSFACQAESVEPVKADAAPVTKSELGAKLKKGAAKALKKDKDSAQWIDCTPYCYHSVILGGSCVEWCGGCPETAGC